MSESTENVSFCAWLISLIWYLTAPTMLLKTTKVHSFWIVLYCVYVTYLLICSFINGHLNWFHISSIVNTAAADIEEWLSLGYDFISFEFTIGSQVSELHSHSLSRLLKSLYSIYHSVCTNLHSFQQHMSSLLSLHHSPDFLDKFYLLDSRHCKWGNMTAHCGFHLHLSGDWRYGVLFHLLLNHKYAFFWELSIQIIACFAVFIYFAGNWL